LGQGREEKGDECRSGSKAKKNDGWRVDGDEKNEKKAYARRLEGGGSLLHEFSRFLAAFQKPSATRDAATNHTQNSSERPIGMRIKRRERGKMTRNV